MARTEVLLLSDLLGQGFCEYSSLQNNSQMEQSYQALVAVTLVKGKAHITCQDLFPYS